MCLGALGLPTCERAADGLGEARRTRRQAKSREQDRLGRAIDCRQKRGERVWMGELDDEVVRERERVVSVQTEDLLVKFE